MKPRTIAGLAALLLLIFLAVQGAKVVGANNEEKRAAIASMVAWRDSARLARADAQNANAYAGRLLPLVSALTDSASTWKRRATLSQRRADSARTAFEIAVTAAPDTCLPVITSARALTDAQWLTIAAQARALGLAELARDTLIRLVTDSLRPALASLIRADAKLDTAAARVVAAVKPKWTVRFLHALIPEIGFGGAAGVDLQRKPNAVAGITLTWNW